MKRLIAIAALTMLAGCASWTQEERVLGSTLTALHVVDYATTKQCLSMPNCHEANPLLGEHPSNSSLALFKSAMAVGQLAIADAMPHSWRTKFLWFANIVQVGVVANNIKTVGFKFGF